MSDSLLTTDKELSAFAIGEELIDCCLYVDSIYGPLEEHKAFFLNVKCFSKEGSLISLKAFGSASNALTKLIAKGDIAEFQTLRAVKINSEFPNSKSPFSYDLLYNENSTCVVIKKDSPIDECSFDCCKHNKKYRIRCSTLATPRVVIRRFRANHKDGEFETSKFLAIKVIDSNKNKAEVYVKEGDYDMLSTKLRANVNIEICAVAKRYGDNSMVKFEVEDGEDIQIL